MTAEEIDTLITSGHFPVPCEKPELKETHISWIILCKEHVFKIKKPVSYPFLDFSTREKRKYYCERELFLNNRLTRGVYLQVVNIRKTPDGISITDANDHVIDHALMMKRLDSPGQMDILLAQGKLGEQDMLRLAGVLSAFHRNTEIIFQKDPLDIGPLFNELEDPGNFRKEHLDEKLRAIISDAVQRSNRFLTQHAGLLRERLAGGFFRDCHGDLHTRNIFMLDEPVIFDCIEFNDEFRRIDVLNEIAFLCMDLEANGAEHLARFFLDAYNTQFTVIRHREDRLLFQYYKSYRANVRAKVNFFRARDARDTAQVRASYMEAMKYLTLMMQYLNSLE